MKSGMGMVVMVLVIVGVGGLVSLLVGRHRRRSGRSPENPQSRGE
jgi:hypothetical protein